MRQAVVPSQYLQIALDLATRIAQGELTEGSRIYGRSVLASEYGVSPETIRKALRLLAEAFYARYTAGETKSQAEER